MPIYEYKCEECGHSFEKLMLGKTDFPVECPKCGSIRVKRLLSSISSPRTPDSSSCPAGSPKGFT